MVDKGWISPSSLGEPGRNLTESEKHMLSSISPRADANPA
jgi:hypothetical protein